MTKSLRTKRRSPSSKKVAASPRLSSGLAPATARDVEPLIERVVTILEEARSQIVRTVNSAMVLAYWHIGREIIEFVQRGSARAEYGEQVLEVLSTRLQERVGRGYSVTNLKYFRTFFLRYAEREPKIRQTPSGELVRSGRPMKIRQTPSGESASRRLVGFSAHLTWSHYQTLSKVESVEARSFYEIEAELERWSVRDLERQIHTQLFARLLKSRNTAGVMDLARRGQAIERPIDLMKSPVVLDFLDLPESEVLRETDLESAILGKLSQFLLELGKGFAFVARQKRVTFEDEHFYVDLVFYNVILKCYLLIDLKLGKLTHQDVGQMDSYIRLFDTQGRTEGDKPTIGLILCAEKNEAVARYSVLHEHEQLFAAKYVTYLPSVEELERELQRDRRLAESLTKAPRRVGASRRRPSSRLKGQRG